MDFQAIEWAIRTSRSLAPGTVLCFSGDGMAEFLQAIKTGGYIQSVTERLLQERKLAILTNVQIPKAS